MVVATLESCLIMINESAKDTIPIEVFETDDAMTLTNDLSRDLYKSAMKAQLPIREFKVGDNNACIEFYEAATKAERDAFLNQCEELIFSKLQEAAPSPGVDGWMKGVLAPEADAMVDCIQKLLDLRRMLRNFAALNENGRKKRPRLILYHAETNDRVD